MKMHTALAVALGALSVSLLAVPSASAAEGDYLGSYSFGWNSNAGAYVTSVVNSSGGNFKTCVSSSASATYYLYEYDPDNPDDLIGSVVLSNGDCHTFYVDNYVDGDNGRAELYLRTSSSAASSAKFWD
jgi:hypothetical protein